MELNPFWRQLLCWLGIDIAISFIYAVIPAELPLGRDVVAAAQLVAMAITMWLATRHVLEDY